MEFQNVPIKKIKANPLNPRQTFEGPAFDELVSSIRANGVLEPIIIRPKGKGFQIVAGERRFRAFSQVAQEDGASQEIPAIIRKLSDEEAFDIMTIENLHREGLTEAEEAYSFKQYVDKKGKGAVEELAERSGISARYIRRRVDVLKLPQKVVEDWEKGEIAFGVLEQLLRLDPQEVEEFYRKARQYNGTSVDYFKRQIDNRTIPLKQALFKIKAAGCGSCNRNTEVQGSIFGDDFIGQEASCLNPSCFIEHQRTHLTENWSKTSYAKKNKTNDFLFSEEVSYDTWSRFWSKENLFPDCAPCASFVTLLRYDGKVYCDMACSNLPCHRSKSRTKISGSENSKTKADHGTIFREAFYKERVPEVARAQYQPEDEKILRLNLIALVRSNDAVKRWFTETVMKTKRFYYESEFEHVWLKVEKMTAPELRDAIREASIVGYFHQYMGSRTRHLIASHLGIDLGSDWLLHEEYLKKKTIKEIMQFGNDLEIFAVDKAVNYLADVLHKKSAGNCKKSELIDLILKSGVDLTGKVPDEIKAVEPVKPEPEETEEEEYQEEEEEDRQEQGGEA